MFVRLSILVSLIILAGCDFIAPAEPVSFTDVEEAVTVRVSGTTVIHSESEWNAFWEQHGRSSSPPEVNFKQQMVVGVFWGGSFHAGCRSEVDAIESVRRDGNVLEVEVGPLPDLGPCRAVAYPFDLIIVNARARRVRFEGKVPGQND